MPTLDDLRAARLLVPGDDALWPGFIPSRVPVLAYDGEVTVLFDGERETHFSGRHPDLTANTAVRLPGGGWAGGGWAAGLLLESLGELDPARLAALTVHEAFHVYQQQRPSPAWDANELDLLDFPQSPAELSARAHEARWLVAALAGSPDWSGAAAQALAWRRERQAHLSARHREVERGLERVEGLAHWTELQLLGEAAQFPDPDFSAAQLRQRTYASGAAWAELLEKTGQPWRRAVLAGAALDELLAAAVQPARQPNEWPGLERWGAAQASALIRAAQTERARVLALPGQRVQVRGHLEQRGFDPLNVTVLPGGEVLHGRSLRFGGAGCEGETLGSPALSLGSGERGVLGAFSTLTVCGLPGLTLRRDGEQWLLAGGEFWLRSSAAPQQDAAGWTLDLSEA